VGISYPRRGRSKASRLALAIAGIVAIQGGGRVDGTTYQYATLDDPSAPVGSTLAYGISGNTIVGTYYDSKGYAHGFSETAGVYTTLNVPGAVHTMAQGISGDTVVGYFWDGTRDHGFSEIGGVYTTLDAPLSTSDTYANGISGSTICGGFFQEGTGTNGFSETGGVYTTVKYPSASYTVANGIAGNTIVGCFDVNGIPHGFVQTAGTYTTLDDPSAQVGTTNPSCVSGSTVFGYFADATNHFHGFSEAAGVYTTVDLSHATNTYIMGVSNSTIVGYFSNSTGIHGFLATPIERTVWLTAGTGTGIGTDRGSVTTTGNSGAGYHSSVFDDPNSNGDTNGYIDVLGTLPTPAGNSPILVLLDLVGNASDISDLLSNLAVGSGSSSFTVLEAGDPAFDKLAALYAGSGRTWDAALEFTEPAGTSAGNLKLSWDFTGTNVTLDEAVVVPEPGTLGMWGLGMAVLLRRRKRRPYRPSLRSGH